MEAKIPHGAKAWTKHAKEASLPILKSTARLLTKQLKAGASLADMAHTIEKDAALGLHLVVAANRENHKVNRETEIIELAHVITILGVHGLIDIIKALPQVVLSEKNAYLKAYWQSQVNGLYAGQMAHYWCSKGSFGSADRIKWSCVFASAPQWVLWRCAYPQMRQWEWMVFKEKRNRREVEQEIFGCYLENLFPMIGRSLSLPATSQRALETNHQPSIKQWAQLLSKRHLDYIDNDIRLKQLRQNGAVLIGLCLYRSQQSHLGWRLPKTWRSDKALAHLLSMTHGAVVDSQYKVALKFSRKLSMRNIILPAQPATWSSDEPWIRIPIRCVFEREKELSEDASFAERGHDFPVGSPREVNKAVLVDIIEKFTRQVASFRDIHQILLTCNKAIFEGLGMRRAFICIMSKSGESLRPLYCVGISDDSPIKRMKIELSSNRFFSKLLQKPGSLKVDHQNFSQASSLVSADILRTLKTKNFMAMSLFANGKPIGVVYADATQAEDSISDKEYSAFKRICQAASHALDNYAIARSQKAQH